MNTGASDRASKQTITTLTEAECRDIHQATETILSRTGVLVDHESARDLLKSAGSTVDGNLVRIPASLVTDALATVPDTIDLHDREGNPAMSLGGNRCYYGTGSDTAYTIDPGSGEPVPTDYETVARFARFADALPNIDFVMSMGIARDRGIASFVAQYDAMVSNTTKPIIFTAQGLDDILAIHEMMKAVYGDENEIWEQARAMLYTEPISPLHHTSKELEMLMFCAERLIPVTVPSGMSAGTTGPVTLAGAIALGNAETLSALVVHQLANPGAPYLYGGNVTAMDMRTANFPYAAPEFHIAFAAYADLGRYYRMPVWGLSGASDSKVIDAQAGLEASYQLLMAQLSGSNLVHDVGYVGSGLTSSMEMLLLCDEIISMVRRIGKGVDINTDTLALDVVDGVGPGGHFITHDHTAQHCREVWTPRFLDRNQLEIWQAAGKKDLYTVLNEEVLRIVKEHTPTPLPNAVRGKLDAIVANRMPAAR